MTDLTIEHFGVPSSGRGARVIDFSRERAIDALAGRTVWCATAIPGARTSAETLREHLESAGVAAGRVETAADEQLLDLAERLDAMLSGIPAEVRLGPADEDLFRQGVQRSEALVGERVRPEDVVVLHDPLTAVLAEAVRERGAHAVWHVRASAASDEALIGEVRVFLGPHTSAMDAYVVTRHKQRRQQIGRGLLVEEVVALMPSPDRVSSKEIEPWPAALSDVGWSSVLADVVEGDRGECVGGTLHPRPAVAVR